MARNVGVGGDEARGEEVGEGRGRSLPSFDDGDDDGNDETPPLLPFSFFSLLRSLPELAADFSTVDSGKWPYASRGGEEDEGDEAEAPPLPQAAAAALRRTRAAETTFSDSSSVSLPAKLLEPLSPGSWAASMPSSSRAGQEGRGAGYDDEEGGEEATRLSSSTASSRWVTSPEADTAAAYTLLSATAAPFLPSALLDLLPAAANSGKWS